jgi:two-component system, cell cycle sensor histidine kinase and response regulator CckA
MQGKEDPVLPKMTGERVEETQARLAAIVNSSDDAIIGKTLEGIITSWNPGAEKVFGYSATEAIGKPMLMLFPPERLNEEKEILEKIARGEKVEHFETVRVRKGGKRIDVSVTLSPIVDGNGKITGASKIARDITERKLAEKSQAQLAEIVQGMNEACFALDREWRFTFVNDRCETLFHHRRDEMLGKSIWDVFAKLVGTPMEKNYRRAMTERVPVAYEAFSPVTQSWLDIRLFPSGDGLAAFLLNIQERKQAEEAIQQRTMELTKANEALQKEVIERKRAQEELIWKTAFLEAQIDSAPDAILVVNENGKRILENERLFQLFKIPKDFAQHDDETKMLQYVIARVKNPKQFSERVAHLYAHPDEIGRDEIGLADGTILDRYSAPVRDKTGKYYGRIWTFRDITGQRKLEEQFRQSQKMEAVGQLAGGVAHDFNNILAIIQMQSDSLRGRCDLTTEQAQYADEISATVDRAAALTRQLLLFSRREVFQPRDLDLSECITSMTKMLWRILGENIRVQLKLAPLPMFIHADAGMMDQVLMNLCVNARDAMPNGGHLIIETSGVEFDEFAVVQSPQTRVGSFVCLSVSDNGCGIPPEIMPKIFEPFFTTKDVGKGTGLGLATVFGIVQQHQGWINVYSEVGHGTTFRIYLPRLGKNQGQKSLPPAFAEMRGGNETILLAEDDPSLRLSVRKALSQLGYRILEAPTGIKALEVWKQNHDEIRLLLTDLVMPDGMNGKDLARHILQDNPGMKVIYMSGYSAEVVGRDFPLKEGINFLTKPFQASKLAQTIRAALDA